MDSVDNKGVVGADKGFSRRDALKRGAVVGGAVVWAVPAVQVLSMSSAMAEKPSPVSPPPPGPPPPQSPPPPAPPRTGKVPSHGIFVVLCGGVSYGIKIDGSTFSKVASPADNAFLAAQGYTYSDPTADVLAMFAGNGGTTTEGELGTFVTIPAGCTLAPGSAFVFDGGLAKFGNKDKYQAASFDGSQIIFYGKSHE